MHSYILGGLLFLQLTALHFLNHVVLVRMYVLYVPDCLGLTMSICTSSLCVTLSSTHIYVQTCACVWYVLTCNSIDQVLGNAVIIIFHTYLHPHPTPAPPHTPTSPPPHPAHPVQDLIWMPSLLALFLLPRARSPSNSQEANQTHLPSSSMHHHPVAWLG